MDASIRIQWLHKKISDNSYPNAKRLAERFAISHRQAQRDVDYLREVLGAPLKYDLSKKGFFYESEFSLPVLFTSGNDEDMMGVLANTYDDAIASAASDGSVIQMQIPYTATIEVKDKLALLYLKRFVTGRAGKDRYDCEFSSTELFMSFILAIDAEIKIVKPEWLREKLVTSAKRIIKANSCPAGEDEE